MARLGTTIELVKEFGGKDSYIEAVRELELALYPTGDSEPPANDGAPKRSQG